MSPIERKAQLVGRLLNAVQEYHDKFGEPIPMKALSARFGKSFVTSGGFPEAIAELERDGSIRVELLRSGGKRVLPFLP
jgi:hypothetical protein